MKVRAFRDFIERHDDDFHISVLLDINCGNNRVILNIAVMQYLSGYVMDLHLTLHS